MIEPSSLVSSELSLTNSAGNGNVAGVSDSRLRRLYDSNVMGIVIANNDGAILEANDAFLDMLGYSRQELGNGLVDWRAITPPEWLPLDERAIDQLSVDGIITQYEKEYFRKDGSRVAISVGGARLAGTADEQICYIVDLSRMREAQTRLRRSESRFRRLSEANLVGIITARVSDGCLVEANDEALRMIGYTRHEFESRPIYWTQLTPPEWREADERALAELRLGDHFTPYEKEYFRKDGSRVAFAVGGVLLEGSHDEVVCYLLDLSDQKHVMRQVRESEERYRMLAEALPQIIIVADESGVPVYGNQYFEAYTGMPVQEAPARWRELVHSDDVQTIENARSGTRSYEVEFRLRRARDGAYRWHFMRTQVVRGDSPGSFQIMATAIDIDDRRRAEESLRFLEEVSSRLSQSIDLQTTFQTLLDIVVPGFADWATINLKDETGIKTVAVRHANPSKAHLASSLEGTHYHDESSAVSTPAVYRTGMPQLLTYVDEAMLRSIVKEAYYPTFAEMGVGSLIVLPIFSRGEVIGSFGVVSDSSGRRYTSTDVPGLQELARRAGFAIENARRYEREHRVADVLQEAALPRSLPHVDGFRLDGFYAPGRDEASIGGDWYDALVLSDGRLVVSIGDVAGSGLDAAVMMGNMRQVIRGVAHVYADPIMMLEAADRALRSEQENRMVTAFVGVIDPVRQTMIYASAGHLPALLRTADGRIAELHAPGLPLGYRGLATSGSRTAILPAGSCLLLHTDGLVESSHDFLAGEAQLRQNFADVLREGGAHPAKALVDATLAQNAGRDDIAVLTVMAT